MANVKNRISLTVIILIAFVALITGIFVYQHWQAPKKINLSAFNGTYLENARPVNDFKLTDTHDNELGRQQLKGQWTMLFFGFTNCDTICPTTMAELAKMYTLLEKDKVVPLPQVIMISVDPERDSLTTLKNYVTAFNPHFLGARGSEEVIKQMTNEMGIAYAKKMTDDAGHYDMQHSGAIMLINPQGELNAFFTMPHHADLLAKDYQLLVS